MQCIAVKFGGSSLADAEHFKIVKDIMFENRDRRYVVPSAPGRISADDKKVTDMFYECHDLARRGENIDTCFDLIKERYLSLIHI